MAFRRLLILLLVPLGLTLGLLRLRFDVEILNLLPARLTAAQGLKAYQTHFSDARELLVTVEGPDAVETEAAARNLSEQLRAATNLVRRVTWQPPWRERPDSTAELLAALWLNQPPATFAKLVDRLASNELERVVTSARDQLATSLSPQDLGRLAYDPAGLTTLLPSAEASVPSLETGEEIFASADGRFRLVFVEARSELPDYRSCQNFVRDLRELIETNRHLGKFSPSVNFQFTGRPVFVAEISSGMEGDMTGSISGTLCVIALLFWLTHRQLKPLLLLLSLLLVLLLATTALAGLLLGTVNVVSLGFASILAGLAEDFGIVIYQESRTHPELDVASLRRQVAPGIIWSAITTAAAFFLLNLSALPGLGQMGTLVAVGILLAAVGMLWGFLPLLLRWVRSPVTNGVPISQSLPAQAATKALAASDRRGWMITGGALGGALILVLARGVQFDRSPNVLRPRHSEAASTLERIQQRLPQGPAPLWVLVPGASEAEVTRRLEQTQRSLAKAVATGAIENFRLPTELWPKPEFQSANRAALSRVLAERPRFEATLRDAGFSSQGLRLGQALFETWARAAADDHVFWPSNDTSQWILRRFAARSSDTAGGWALGVVQPGASEARRRQLAAHWPAELIQEGILLSGWDLLGSTVFELVWQELPRVLIPIAGIVIGSLWLAFRNWREVALSLGTLLFSGVCLLGAMNLLGWRWNLLNLMALPLLVGMGVDFGIHLQLALRQAAGNCVAVRRSMGRALLLAGSTTVAGFASLAFSKNAGLASLGQVAGLGIGITLLVAVYLLPTWWKTWAGSLQPTATQPPKS